MKAPKLSPNTRRILLLSLFLAVSLILSWVERFIPMPAMIPGLKIGLANAAILFVLYSCGFGYALMVSAARILLANLLFGSLTGILYSACGALLSLVVMWLLRRSGRFGIAGISAVGGVFHNIGQILAACLLVGSNAPLAYLPLLVLGGAASGVLIGVCGGVLVQRIRPLIEDDFLAHKDE